MKIKTLKLGPLQTNCYILIKNNNCLIIDPADEYEKIIDNIKDLKLLGILITHNHFDHIGALPQLIEIYKIPLIDSTIQDKNIILELFKFEIIKTNGHSNTSITFYFEEANCMFVGDFIFKNNIGRCDLPTGNYHTMLESIENIKKYPDDIILYPGHGDSTILKEEKENNHYFKIK